MKEKIYKYSAISLLLVNFITLYLFYDYFTEKPAMFHGLGILMNFFSLIIIAVGLGITLLMLRLFYKLKRNKNILNCNFVYIFSAIFGLNLFINWVICLFLKLIKLDLTLNLTIFALLIISSIIIIDIYKSNFTEKIR